MVKRKFSALAASLKKQQEEHKKSKPKLNQTKQESAVLKPTKKRGRPLIPFTQSDAILFVGEGNFSFAASCVEQHLEHAELVTATSLDSQATLLTKYPDAQTHIDTILECCGSVQYCIDGTRLGEWFGQETFDVVVFMFPHVAAGIADEARNVLTNQKMLLGFFKSVQQVLKPEGTVAVTLACSKTYELWDLKGLAKKQGLVVKTSGVFEGQAFPGYTHARTQGYGKNDAGFSGGRGEERSARWTIFMQPPKQSTQAAAAASSSDKKRSRRGGRNDAEDDDEDD